MSDLHRSKSGQRCKKNVELLKGLTIGQVIGRHIGDEVDDGPKVIAELLPTPANKLHAKSTSAE